MSEQGVVVEVRPAAPSDVTALRGLFGEASGETCLRLATSGGVLVAVAGDEVVGVGDCDECGQAAVFVAAGWRGRGVGRRLASALGRPAAKTAVLGDVA